MDVRPRRARWHRWSGTCRRPAVRRRRSRGLRRARHRPCSWRSRWVIRRDGDTAPRSPAPASSGLAEQHRAGVRHDRPPGDPERQVGQNDHQVPPAGQQRLPGSTDDLTVVSRGLHQSVVDHLDPPGDVEKAGREPAAHVVDDVGGELVGDAGGGDHPHRHVGSWPRAGHVPDACSSTTEPSPVSWGAAAPRSPSGTGRTRGPRSGSSGSRGPARESGTNSPAQY